jgi:hypothetical protein
MGRLSDSAASGVAGGVEMAEVAGAVGAAGVPGMVGRPDAGEVWCPASPSQGRRRLLVSPGTEVYEGPLTHGEPQAHLRWHNKGHRESRGLR